MSATRDDSGPRQVWPYPLAQTRRPVSRLRGKGASSPQTELLSEKDAATPRSARGMDASAIEAAPPGPEHPWGICLSGGGIRAASFGLGALQAMERRGMLRGPRSGGAHYLSAVSGGSYITGAYTLLALQLRGEGAPMTEVPPFYRPLAPPVPDGQPTGQGSSRQAGHAVDGAAPPISPEERHLYDHTLYLTHGPGGAVGALWHLLLGITWNVALLALAVLILARPAGWVTAALYPELRSGSIAGTMHAPAAAWLLLGTLVALALLFGMVALAFRVRPWTIVAEDLSRSLCGLAALWLVVLGLPYALEGVRWLFGPLTDFQTTAQAANRLGAAVGVGGTLSIAAALTRIRRLWAGQPKAASVGSDGPVRRFLGAHRTALLNLVAFVAGPLLLIAWFLFNATQAVDAGPRADWPKVVVSAGVLVAMFLAGNLNAWSPHSYYFERLASMFAIRRLFVPREIRPTEASAVDPSCVVKHGSTWVGAVPWPIGFGSDRRRRSGHPGDVRLPKLSESQPEDFPEVLICAAANVNDYGSIPTGFNATSFVFSANVVGGPLVGAVRTTEFEEIHDITLPEAVSISGAAVAPDMGKMTRAPLRFLMTMLNLRLGVWLPNPRHIEEFRSGRRALTARPQYLLREMLGQNHLDAGFLYVSDGGHYENLGLVEQLRRRSEWVFCIDASGDGVDTFHTLGEAIAIAKAELGVLVDIAPEHSMAPRGPKDPAASHAPWVRSVWCRGTIHYPDRAEPGTLVYIKAGVPSNAPWDIVNFAERHASFPADPTLDQLYDAERVEAYRSLGEFAAEIALEGCCTEFEEWRVRTGNVPQKAPSIS